MLAFNEKGWLSDGSLLCRHASGGHGERTCKWGSCFWAIDGILAMKFPLVGLGSMK